MSEHDYKVGDRIFTRRLDVFGRIIEVLGNEVMIESEWPLTGLKHRLPVDERLRHATETE